MVTVGIINTSAPSSTAVIFSIVVIPANETIISSVTARILLLLKQKFGCLQQCTATQLSLWIILIKMHKNYYKQLYYKFTQLLVPAMFS